MSVASTGRGQDFERDHLAQRMNRLVNPPHLPFADAVENLVLAEEEVVRAATLEERGLVFREHALIDEVLAE